MLKYVEEQVGAAMRSVIPDWPGDPTAPENVSVRVVPFREIYDVMVCNAPALAVDSIRKAMKDRLGPSLHEAMFI